MTLQVILLGILTILFGYLVGSISTASIVGYFKGVRIKEVGSKNAGATNVLRHIGKKWAVFTVFADMTKPIISAGIAFWFIHSYMDGQATYFMQLASLAASVGHVFPIFLKFKGGKGAACTAGIITLSNWVLFILGLILFFAILLKTKYASIASMGSIITLTILYGLLTINSFLIGPMFSFFNPDDWYITITVLWLTTLLVIFAHRSNIKKLMNGTERKIGKTKT